MFDKGVKSDVFQMEENIITLQFVQKPDNNGKITCQKTLDKIVAQADELFKNIEILALATKTVPDWLKTMKTHDAKCAQQISRKIKKSHITLLIK